MKKCWSSLLVALFLAFTSSSAFARRYERNRSRAKMQDK